MENPEARTKATMLISSPWLHDVGSSQIRALWLALVQPSRLPKLTISVPGSCFQRAPSFGSQNILDALNTLCCTYVSEASKLSMATECTKYHIIV